MLFRDLGRRASLLIVSAVVGCGGGGVTPTRPSPPAAGIPAGTTLLVTFVHTGTPAPRVGVNIGGRIYTTDGQGQIQLTETAVWGSLLDIVGPDSLDRQTVVRVSTGNTLTVWPSTTESGIDPNYTANLVYTAAGFGGGALGAAALDRLRPGTTEVVVVPEPALQANPRSLQAHQDAAERMTAASGARVVYRLAAERPPSGVVVETRYLPTDPLCVQEPTVSALFRSTRTAAGEITGGTVVYCYDRGIADYTNLILHELGHTFGLKHSPDATEVMRAPGRSSGYMSRRESEVMLLLLARPAGNRHPDNDRSVTSAVARETTIACTAR